MRTLIKITTGAGIFAVGVSVLLSGCVTSDWQVARTTDSVAGYKTFIEQHPDTRLSAEARSRIAALERDAAEAERRAAETRRVAEERRDQAIRKALLNGDLGTLCQHDPEPTQVETLLKSHWTSISSTGLAWLSIMANQQGHVVDVSRSGTLSTTDGIQRFEFIGLTRGTCGGKRLIYFRSGRLGDRSLLETCIYGDDWFAKK